MRCRVIAACSNSCLRTGQIKSVILLFCSRTTCSREFYSKAAGWNEWTRIVRNEVEYNTASFLDSIPKSNRNAVKVFKSTVDEGVTP